MGKKNIRSQEKIDAKSQRSICQHKFFLCMFGHVAYIISCCDPNRF